MSTTAIAEPPYTLRPADADLLAAAALVPADVRAELLRRIVDQRGVDELVSVFAEFIGLAVSVAENCRTVVDLILLDAGLHPDQAERANLPTIVGALAGVRLAAGVAPAPAGMCDGCAYRVGTAANQSPATTHDAAYCAEEGHTFMCHHDGLDDETSAPTKVCAGWAKARSFEAARTTRIRGV